MGNLETKSFCAELIEENRLFTILSEKLGFSEHYDENLYAELERFINDYIAFHSLDKDEVKNAYVKYIKSYNKDVRAFNETGKFPLELNPEREAPNRIDYNIILLLSTILTPHRFRIMQIIKQNLVASNKGLFIGCGPGLEIQLTQDKIDLINAYDLTLDSFLDQHFDKVNFYKEYFDGTNSDGYDCIFLIEILEHLSDPYMLLEICKNVLTANGKIFLTTATNIPQFDHLYNFSVDHIQFDNKLKELGLKVILAEDIVHPVMTTSANAQNKFYIVEKV